MKIYLEDFGLFLGRKRNRFVVRREKEKKEFLSDEVESIICLCKGVSFSASAVELAIEKGVHIIFAKYGGWPYAVVMPTSVSGSVKARREQFLAYNDERGFELSVKFIYGKLRNQANLLKLWAKNRRGRDDTTAEELYNAGKKIDEIAAKVAEKRGTEIEYYRINLMNLEAEAARHYWEAVGEIIPDGYSFPGRVTRGAKDPVNCMLNLGYQAVLFPEVWKAVAYAGLDPYAGYLHADRPGKPSMVLDLMEEFRQQIVDRVLIRLLTKRVLNPDEVMSPDEPNKLRRKTVQTLLEKYEGRLENTVAYEGRRHHLKSIIHLQARRIVRFLINNTKYRPFIVGW